MNPIFTWLIAHTTARALARKCLRCGRTQIVPKEKRRDIVPCRWCGASIPPKRSD